MLPLLKNTVEIGIVTLDTVEIQSLSGACHLPGMGAYAGNKTIYQPPEEIRLWQAEAVHPVT